MKTIVLSLLLIVFVRSLPAFSDNGVNSDHKNIIAGIPRSFPPQYITDEKGISTGLAIDLMDAIALKAGLHIQYKVMETWAEVYEALKQGDVHIVPNLGITREREGFVDFTVPLETFAVSTFIRKDSVNIQSFNDLSGLNVGAVESNVGARLLKDRRDINLTVYDGFPEALLELLSGHIEGIVYPEPVVWRLAQEANLDHKIQVLSPPLLEIKRAIGVIKDHPVLFQKIQNATIAFVKTNEFQEILSKWNGEPTPYWTIHRLFWIMILVMVIMSIVFFIWRYIEILSLNNKLLFETKQKRSAENALKKLNDELEGRIQHRTKELAEAMRVGQMGSWEIDLLDNKSKWSEQLFKLLEIDPLNVKASSKAFFNTVHPDDREKVHKAYINSIESVSPYVITHRLLMSDGRTKWVEERSESSFNKQGKAVISRGTVQDITLQKQAELKLEQQHSLLMSFIETIPDAVYIKDGRGAWQLVNQVGLSLFQMGEFPWQGKTELELSQQRPGFSEAHEACLISDENAWNSGEIVIDYEKLNDEDGNSRVLEVRKMPLFDKKGERQSLLIIGRDITEQKSSQKKLQLAASVFSHAHEGITITGLDGLILDVNQAFTDITGYSHDEVIGKNPRVLQSGIHKPPFYKAMWDDLIQKNYWYGEIWNRRKDGEVYAEMLNINAVKGADGETLHYVALFSDITNQKKAQQQLEHMAHYDTLTNLPNRVLLSDRLQQAMSHANRTGQLLAVAYLDLDGFKEINDTYDHNVGDDLLIGLAKQLKEAQREEDTIARIGGDEFIAILSDLSHENDCIPLLDRMLAAASRPLYINDIKLQVSASVGVSFYPQEKNIDADQLIRQADQAMYQAKLGGKNRFQIFDAIQDQNIRGFNESLTRIKLAFKNNEFTLFYQPKVNMRTGDITGLEALIRWQHPERGLLLPVSFLPVIQNSIFSIELGNWVIESALAQMDQWQQLGFYLPVSVNIDALHLQQPDFCVKLTSALQKYPTLKEGSLELEVLETSALDDMSYVSKLINHCKEINVNFALDDFGTGYSSLTYLKRLPASTLKIDRSFVREEMDPKNRTVA